MALQVVQRVLVQGAGTVAAVTTAAITTTPGNLLVAIPIAFSTGHIGATPITDSKGNTWTSAIAAFGGSQSNEAMHYVANCLGGASHTFTFTGATSGLLVLIVYEIAGAALSSVLGSTSTSIANTATHATGTITSNATVPELFLGVLGLSATEACSLPIAPPAGSDWSGLSGVGAGANMGGMTAFRIVGPSVTDSFQLRRTPSVARVEAIMIAGFKAAVPIPVVSSGGAYAFA
jgi:hypothetical protein